MGVVRQIFGAEGNALVLMGSDQAEVFQRFGGFLSRPGGSLESEGGEAGEGGEGSGSAPSIIMVLLDEAAGSAADYTVDSLSVTGTASTEALPLANVIGQLTGNRPDEYVIFSAHYDHVGVREGMEGDNIFNGANDDASGVTAVIELARYFATRPKPERTILFVAFTAEESGGYGSRYLAGHVDPEQIVAMFNIEMIGKPAAGGPGSTWVTGFDRSSLGEIMNAAVQGHSYEFTPDPYPGQNLFMRSDNAALAALGVPAHSLSSTPMEDDPDYHQPSDEVDTLDLANMTDLIRAIALGAAPVISGEATPTRVEGEEG
jgi:Zn-dependent M28 family amino/carboxypeptidase